METKPNNNELQSPDFTNHVVGTYSTFHSSVVSISPRFKYPALKGRIIKGESQTVPNQAYSVREIYERSILNSPAPIKESPAIYSQNQDEEYLFSLEGTDPSRLDLVELQELQELMASRVIEYREKGKKLEQLYKHKLAELRQPSFPSFPSGE